MITRIYFARVECLPLFRAERLQEKKPTVLTFFIHSQSWFPQTEKVIDEINLKAIEHFGDCDHQIMSFTRV